MPNPLLPDGQSPSLDQLAADPVRASVLPPDEATRLLTQVHVLEGVLLGRLLACQAERNGPPEAPADSRLLTSEQAAQLMGVNVSWLYRHAKRLPFARRLSRKCLRFSEAGLRKWQSTRRA